MDLIPNLDLMQYVGSVGGIGGIFGVVIFIVYRQSTKQLREDRKFMEDRLTGILDAYNKTSLENTKVLTELITWLKAKNGSR